MVRSKAHAAPRLQDRHTESRALDALIAGARNGTSGALILHGEAGAGKTALLDHLLLRAAGCRVVRTAGVESEMELAFAGLHLLCSPFLDRLDRLPAPQRDALGTAFGVRSGDPPDRFLIGLAVLSLLSDAASEQPLVCLVDDAQWLDRASSQVLGFVARRLGAESIVIVFAVRSLNDVDQLAGLPRLAVSPLEDADARELLASAMPGRLDESVRDRIVAEARGNPLALLELPRSWTPAFGGGFALPDDQPVSSRVEESFRSRLVPLPEQCRRLLLIAAAEPIGDPVLIRAAAERLGITADAAGPASAAGLIEVGPQFRFRHPLVRSVVYREAPPEERWMAHAALAEATDGAADPDRRAWHLAAAAHAPDEGVAAELQRSAGRAQARGGFAAAAAFLRRAVALTPEPGRRADRALAATRACLGAGAFDAARQLLADAEAGPLDALGRARVDLLQAELAFAQERGGDAPRLLLQAANKLQTLDIRLARDTLLDAWAAALFAGHLARDRGLADVSQAVAAAPPPEGGALARDALLDGLGLIFTQGREAAVPVLRTAVDAFANPDAAADELLGWGWLATRAANYLWDYEACLQIGLRTVQIARDSGALDALAVADNACGQAAAFGGDIASAARLAAELQAVKDATGTRIPPHAALVLAGMRGTEAEATGLIDATIAAATAGGQGTAVQYAQWARSVLMNGLGRYDEAFEAATHASRATPELSISAWALIELIEAAARSDRAAVASEALTRLQGHVDGPATDWGLGILARSRALQSAGEAAEVSFREAIERLERTALRPDVARAHLVYGEWLRRENRRADARDHLREAHALFETIGMAAFAERARRELRSTGETVRKRTVENVDGLTAQELQIASLASDGLTNQEIGARLFLSPRTVEWHLRHVFSKLGVSSRRELRGALSETTLGQIAV